MERDKLWAKFTQTGKVTDYLEYCGVDIGNAAVNRVTIQEEPHETDHRRTDHTGKQ